MPVASDLIFPHHENEIAQSEGASGKLFARCWMHNGFVTIDEEKMAKSLGNFFTIREVIAKFEPEALRLFSAWHAQPQPDQLLGRRGGRGRAAARLFLRDALEGGCEAVGANGGPFRYPPAQAGEGAFVRRSMLRSTTTSIRPRRWRRSRRCSPGSAPELLAKPSRAKLPDIAKLAGDLREATAILGLLRETPSAYLARRYARVMKERGIDSSQVQQLIDRRAAVRAAKDFAAADAFRQELLGLGVEVKDTPAGTVWKPLLSSR